jgi:uncharacterized delta-60 repeat protein
MNAMKNRFHPRLEALEDRRLMSAGSLDPTFGMAGKVIRPLSNNTAFSAQDVAIQPNGRIVVAGDDGNDFVVARYLPNGQLDTSFGNGGVRTIDFDGGVDWANAVAIQNDGRIVVAGTALVDGDFDFAVTRLTEGGNVEFTDTRHIRNDDVANDVVILADGSIALVGTSDFGPASDFGVAIWDRNGERVARHEYFFGGQDEAYAATILPGTGGYRFVVVGTSDATGGGDVLLVSLDQYGRLDTGFDNDGWDTISLGAGPDIGYDVAVQDGKLLIAAGSVGEGTLLRYVPHPFDGILDVTFGNNGISRIDFGPNDALESVQIQADGKIVVTGDTQNPATRTEDVFVARSNPNGTLDGAFGTNGVSYLDFGSPDRDYGDAVALQPDGKIIVLGTTFTTTQWGFALARVERDNPPEVQPPPIVAPSVQVIVNDGARQRSMVTRVTITFSTFVTVDPGAIELLRNGSTPVAFRMDRVDLNHRTVLNLTFPGGRGGSLADGNYTLIVHNSRVRDRFGTALDGDFNRVAGGDRIDEFFRLYGDRDGNGVVSTAELARLQRSLNKRRGQAGYFAEYDFDANGRLENRDLAQLRRRVGQRI